MNWINEITITLVTVLILSTSISTITKISYWLSNWEETEQRLHFYNSKWRFTDAKGYIFPSLIFWGFQGWLLSASSSPLWIWELTITILFLLAIALFINRTIAAVILSSWSLIIYGYWIILANTHSVNTNWLDSLNVSIPIPKVYALAIALFVAARLLFGFSFFLTPSAEAMFSNGVGRENVNIKDFNFDILVKVLIMLISPCCLSLIFGFAIGLFS